MAQNSGLTWKPGASAERALRPLDDIFAPQADAAPVAPDAFAAAPVVYHEAAISAAASPYQQVAVNNGGATINLEFVRADAPTTKFEEGVINAAMILSAAVKVDMTVNLTVGFGEVEGEVLNDGSAAAGPNGEDDYSYATVRAALIAHAAAGDPNFNALPAGTSIDGHGTIAVWSTEEKALGLISATDNDIDGVAGFASDISSSLLTGVALHELSHAMGRVPFTDPNDDPDIFELTRFSAPGHLVVDDDVPGPASYFSIDGGATALATYGQDSDPSDFANPLYGTPTSNLSPDDPLNQYYDSDTFQFYTALDLTQLDVLGFNTYVAPPPPPLTPAPVYDFNGDGKSDILFVTTNNLLRAWESNANGGRTFATLTALGPYTVVGVGDFNRDGVADLALETSTGVLHLFESHGPGEFVSVSLGNAGPGWSVAGIGDFNDDQKSDILLQTSAGAMRVLESDPSGGFASVALPHAPSGYEAIGVGDFNGDGYADILLQDSSGDVAVMDSDVSGGFTTEYLSSASAGYTFAGVGDFNDDGKSDIVWQNTSTNQVQLWDATIGGFETVQIGPVGAGFTVQGVGDYLGDGYSDLLARNAAGIIHLIEFSAAGHGTANLGNPGATVVYPLA